MTGYEDRASILQGLGPYMFNLVCDRATPRQWAEWLRVPLEHAAGTGDADLVNKLLRAGAFVSARWNGCNGRTLLHAAAEGGNEHVVSTFVRAGAKKDLEEEAPAGRETPLHLAASGGHAGAVKVLTMAGADVNALNAAGDGPLHLAIENGHAAVAENLLLRGADPSVKGRNGYFPINRAARRGQDGVVRAILHKGVQVDHLSVDEWTPLGDAVRCGHLPTVEVLLAGGADVTIPCFGNTPLHMAAQGNNADILVSLLEYGADIEARNVNGHTPLHRSAFYNSDETTLALLRREANVHAHNSSSGSTPLHVACLKGNLDVAGLLLRWGADETAFDKRGRTPSYRIPYIAAAAEQDRPRLKRLSKLLASAPQDRAWRRRGMLVLCRAHPDRLRPVAEIPGTAEDIGQPQGRPSRRARRKQEKVEVTIGGARSAGAWGAGSRAGGGDGGGGLGGFDGVAAWLMVLEEEGVFRKIVGFL